MTEVKFRDDIVVQPINISANDKMVVAAARVSTEGEKSLESLGGKEKLGLINYLVKNHHGSPFEHNLFTFYVEAPIAVFREWQRHRIGFSYNEQSGRYSELPAEFYIPPRERKLVQIGKTGHYEFTEGTDEQYALYRSNLRESYKLAYELYEKNLSLGVAKEAARFNLPVGLYSRMYVSCNARSIMNFLQLRTEVKDAMFVSKPMYEIAEAAAQVEEIFAAQMPATYKAFCDAKRVAP